MLKKKCSTCRNELPTDRFSKNRNAADGLQDKCKACVSVYMKERSVKQADRLRAVAKAYYRKNQEACKKRVRARWDEKKDELNAERRNYYHEHNAECRAAARAYNAIPEVAERKRLADKAYYEANRPAFLAKVKEYKKTDAGRAARRKATANYRANHPERAAAYDAVKAAVRSGKLIRASNCQNCGGSENIEAHHHHGYSEEHKLDVQWLCKKCHRLAHGKTL